MTMKEYKVRLNVIAILWVAATVVFMLMPYCRHAFYFLFLDATFMTCLTLDALEQGNKAKEEEGDLLMNELLGSEVLSSYDWGCIAGIERFTSIILFSLSLVSMIANICFG